MDNHAFRLVNEVARRFPRTIPRLNRFASAVASQRERVDWSHAIFASAAGALRGDGVRACRASTRSRPSARARAALERHPVAFPIELRFSAADDALLSPAHGRDSAFVAVHVFKGHGVRGRVPRGRGRDVGRSAGARTGASAPT